MELWIAAIRSAAAAASRHCCQVTTDVIRSLSLIGPRRRHVADTMATLTVCVIIKLRAIE